MYLPGADGEGRMLEMEDLDFEKREILAIDLKSFYASVECIDRGLDPFKVPLIVCDPDRGDSSIVMAVSPYLKAMGVPSRCQRRDVPDVEGLIVAVPRMARYLEVSARINDIYLRHVDEDNLHVYSVDESFLDVTDFLEYAGTDAMGLARRIIKEVKDETGLTVCAGSGQNLFLAKAAMDIEAKHNPDFTARWTIEDVPQKLWPVSPLSKIWGIGSRMEKRLNDLGLFTAGEVAAFDPQILINRIGIIGGEIWLHCNGVDRSIISRRESRAQRCLSVGQQLHLPAEGETIHLLAREIAREMALRLNHLNLTSRELVLWMGGDEDWSASVRLPRGVSTSRELEEVAETLLRKRKLPKRIFRIGMAGGFLEPESHIQLDLTTDWKRREKDRAMDRTIAAIRDHFGPLSAVRLSSLREDSTSLRRAVQIGGHRA